MIQFSIIITTFNSSSLIVGCLDSILANKDLDSDMLEIIIVDNSNDKEFDHLVEITQNYPLPLRILKSGGNIGYGAGNNLGVSFAGGAIICIMNPDVRLLSPLYKLTLAEFETDSNLCLLGYKQIGGKNLSFYLKPEYFVPILSSVIVKLFNKLDIFITRFFFISGAFFFISKEKFNELGGFDENMFLYGEESELARKIKKNRFNVKYNGSICYKHLVGDRTELSEFSFKEWLKSRYYYFSKYNLNAKRHFSLCLLDYRLAKLALVFKENKIKEDQLNKQIILTRNFLKDKNVKTS